MRRPSLCTISLALCLSLFLPSQSVDATTAKDLQLEPWVVIGDELRKPLLSLSDEFQANLLAENWEEVLVRLSEMKKVDAPPLAFIHAWALIQVGRPGEGIHLAPLVIRAPVPADHMQYVAGTLAWAAGDEATAQERFAKMDATSELWMRSQVAVAKALVAAERTDEALRRLEALDLSGNVNRSAATALLQLATLYGLETEQGRKHLVQLSVEYPNSPEAGKSVVRAVRRNPAWTDWAAIGRRAEGLSRRGKWSTIIQETESHAAKVPRDTLDGCRFHYTRGRALYKRNRLGDSMGAFKGLGESCAGVDVDYGARALYLNGYAAFRRGETETSASSYGAIPILYPESSYADDGYTRAGIAKLEMGDLKGAQALWAKGIADHADGDTVPESQWRLAWTSYLDGDVDSAIQSADRLAQVDLGVGGRFVSGGRYWSARWKMFPNVEDPRQKTDDSVRVKQAIAEWISLCEDMPHSFYALLAFSRLKEHEPAAAERLLGMKSPVIPEGAPDEPWFVRLSFLEDENIRNGVALARVGLIREAQREWRGSSFGKMEAAEMAWMTELRLNGGDWLLAHDAMREWMKSNPAGGLGAHEQQVLRVAYPDRYWPEVQAAAEPMEFEARLFHALVREESNFNQNIVSYAGARGLSQVMPKTAIQTAKWLGKKIRLEELFDPETNLQIGAKYLDVVYKQTGESPFLALAAYNAGPGRVFQWTDRYGDVPIDEYIENIPIRQTRVYVKRVMESWQTYRWHFDEGPGFPDLSRFNHHANLVEKGG